MSLASFKSGVRRVGELKLIFYINSWYVFESTSGFTLKLKLNNYLGFK